MHFRGSSAQFARPVEKAGSRGDRLHLRAPWGFGSKAIRIATYDHLRVSRKGARPGKGARGWRKICADLVTAMIEPVGVSGEEHADADEHYIDACLGGGGMAEEDVSGHRGQGAGDDEEASYPAEGSDPVRSRHQRLTGGVHTNE
jgi:hypothetical protein